MQADLTEIVMVIDRSGSMNSRLSDANGGIAAFIDDQKKHPNRANLTIIAFDDQYEVVCNGVDIKKFDKYEIVPRGMTAMLDGIGKAIVTTDERLSKIPEDERPGLVYFKIVTDGQENSSKEYNIKQIQEMIAHQKEKYNWQFTFLGTDITNTNYGASLGTGIDNSASVGAGNYKAAYELTSGKLNIARTVVASTGNSNSVNMSFTNDEKETLK